jgi:hypothetical protein
MGKHMKKILKRVNFQKYVNIIHELYVESTH